MIHKIKQKIKKWLYSHRYSNTLRRPEIKANPMAYADRRELRRIGKKHHVGLVVSYVLPSGSEIQNRLIQAGKYPGRTESETPGELEKNLHSDFPNQTDETLAFHPGLEEGVKLWHNFS